MAKRKRNLKTEGGDVHAANNLYLSGRSFGELSPLVNSIRKNLLRKIARGTFDFDKSIAAWRAVADQTDKILRADEMRKPPSQVKGFTHSVATRNLAAKMFAHDFMTEAQYGDEERPFGELTHIAEEIKLTSRSGVTYLLDVEESYQFLDSPSDITPESEGERARELAAAEADRIYREIDYLNKTRQFAEAEKLTALFEDADLSSSTFGETYLKTRKLGRSSR